MANTLQDFSIERLAVLQAAHHDGVVALELSTQHHVAVAGALQVVGSRQLGGHPHGLVAVVLAQGLIPGGTGIRDPIDAQAQLHELLEAGRVIGVQHHPLQAAIDLDIGQGLDARHPDPLGETLSAHVAVMPLVPGRVAGLERGEHALDGITCPDLQVVDIALHRVTSCRRAGCRQRCACAAQEFVHGLHGPCPQVWIVGFGWCA
ncbi:hypothetical protein D3C78_993590 [compost metagenome]